jgi:uncharacterized protein YndB with AHSA1/START domain
VNRPYAGKVPERSGRTVSVSRTIPAAPEAIFAVLADPGMHPVIDGSGSVRQSRNGNPERLEMGSRFSMDMRIGLPYLIRNSVVEYEPDRLIAWRHFNGHRWRYRLEPIDDGEATEVTETFDWSTARVPRLIELMGYPERHPEAMERTLEGLERVVTADEGR